MTATERLGVEWEVRRLGDHLRFLRHGTNSRSELTADGAVQYLHYGDIHTHASAYLDLDVSSMPCLPIERARSLDLLDDGDLVFVDASEDIEGVGKSVEIKGLRDRHVVSGLHTIAIRFNRSVLADDFKAYLQYCPEFLRHLRRLAAGTKVYATNRAHIASAELRLPPVPEQRAIAAVLADVDELIGSLEALIAKKRAIKQAAMQELLTGRTRLPGFGGEWERRRLEDLVDCLDHLRVPLNESQRRDMPGPFPYCGANGVVDHIADYLIDDDVILIAEDGGYFDEYEDRAIAYRMKGKIWVNNHAHVLKAKRGFSQGFLLCALAHKNILRFLASGTRAKLNRGEMDKIVVLLPRHEEEQQAIATVLSDMDAEIAALEHRLDKTRAIKQGVMQQLLTGSIRLPIPDYEAEDDDAHAA